MSAEVWTHLWADWSVAERRRTEAPVTLDAQTRQMVAANEADWDARAPLHAASRFYSQPAEYWFADYEWADLGPLDGRDVLHLQCHLGTETIAFARRGARVTGLDLSRKSLEEARQIAADAEQDTGDEVPGRHRSYEWRHGLGEIVTTLATTGFHLTTLRESEVLPWPRWPSMQQTPEGWWRLPDEAPRIPLLFALKATR